MAARDNDDKQHQDKHDQHFYDTFMLVLGILVAFAVCMYWLANGIADATPGAYERGSATEEQLIDQRLAPVGDVQISGNAASQMPAAAPAAAASGAPKSGKEIWEGTCSACHRSGLLGAPKIGDKAAWAPRIAKGLDVLKQHALHGFNQMPAHGGNMALTDAEVISALEYMVSQSK
ncbi:MAG TPA: c-type cytochrome [Gammaproteobacteria bacterium]|nr:c-type cytochrome [Gammaproteobacteria bacterium]